MGVMAECVGDRKQRALMLAQTARTWRELFSAHQAIEPWRNTREWKVLNMAISVYTQALERGIVFYKELDDPIEQAKLVVLDRPDRFSEELLDWAIGLWGE